MHTDKCSRITHSPSHPIPTMPTKLYSELTKAEVTLLGIAAKFFAALGEHMAHPPPESINGYWAVKTDEDMVC